MYLAVLFALAAVNQVYSNHPDNGCTHDIDLGVCVRDAMRSVSTHHSYLMTAYAREEYTTTCGTFGWDRCTRYRQVSRATPAYRIAYKTVVDNCSEIYCCDGYQGDATDCQPVCTSPCQNGGTCTAPDVCTCADGWTGDTCNKTKIQCKSPCPDNRCSHMPDMGVCVRDTMRSVSTHHSYLMTAYAREEYTTTCGFASWDRCTRYRQVTRAMPAYRIAYETVVDNCSEIYCCDGYQGNATDCQPVCTSPCQNGGTCTAPDVCTCTGEWTGDTCHGDGPVCTSPCQNGGTCTAPDVCTCADGWTGDTCDEPVCTSPCQNGGTCTAPDVCTCADEWTGDTCDEPVCTSPCQNGGTCTAPDVCTCTDGWTGDTCNEPVCTSPCQNGGTCTAPDVCTCADEWTGDTCDTSESVCRRPCQNGGTCTAPDVCTCTDGWTGRTCNRAVCKIKCKNGGTCTGPDQCTCRAQWTGKTCKQRQCTPPCAVGGKCLKNNMCVYPSTYTCVAPRAPMP